MLNPAASLLSTLLALPFPIGSPKCKSQAFGKPGGAWLCASTTLWVADLGEHGFAVLGHHAALVTVERHKIAVECLLGVLKHIV